MPRDLTFWVPQKLGQACIVRCVGGRKMVLAEDADLVWNEMQQPV